MTLNLQNFVNKWPRDSYFFRDPCRALVIVHNIAWRSSQYNQQRVPLVFFPIDLVTIDTSIKWRKQLELALAVDGIMEYHDLSPMSALIWSCNGIDLILGRNVDHWKPVLWKEWVRNSYLPLLPVCVYYNLAVSTFLYLTTAKCPICMTGKLLVQTVPIIKLQNTQLKWP